jgi:hypothetical protein
MRGVRHRAEAPELGGAGAPSAKRGHLKHACECVATPGPSSGPPLTGSRGARWGDRGPRVVPDLAIIEPTRRRAESNVTRSWPRCLGDACTSPGPRANSRFTGSATR